MTSAEQPTVTAVQLAAHLDGAEERRRQPGKPDGSSDEARKAILARLPYGPAPGAPRNVAELDQLAYRRQKLERGEGWQDHAYVSPECVHGVCDECDGSCPRCAHDCLCMCHKTSNLAKEAA